MQETEEPEYHAAPVPDGVWARILQKMADPLSLPMSIIFQRQLDEGKVQYICRMANVCTIFKKGTKGDPVNYCPLSLICIVGKVFESLMKDRMVKHLVENSLIRPSQHRSGEQGDHQQLA